MKYLLLIVFLFGFICTAQKEVIDYNVYRKKNLVGVLHMSKEQTNGLEVYKTTFDMAKDVTFVKSVDYNLTFTLKNGKLLKSNYAMYINGKLKKSSSLELIDGKYSRTVNGKTKEAIDTPILLTSTMLYFQPPDTINKTVFSETRQVYRNVYYEDEGSVVKIGKNAKHTDTHFNYDGDTLKQVDIIDFIDFTIKPTEK